MSQIRLTPPPPFAPTMPWKRIPRGEDEHPSTYPIRAVPFPGSFVTFVLLLPGPGIPTVQGRSEKTLLPWPQAA